MFSFLASAMVSWRWSCVKSGASLAVGLALVWGTLSLCRCPSPSWRTLVPHALWLLRFPLVYLCTYTVVLWSSLMPSIRQGRACCSPSKSKSTDMDSSPWLLSLLTPLLIRRCNTHLSACYSWNPTLWWGLISPLCWRLHHQPPLFYDLTARTIAARSLRYKCLHSNHFGEFKSNQ